MKWIILQKNLAFKTMENMDNTTIVKRILDVMGKSEDLIEYVEDRPGHDFRYSMSSSKISKELGWTIIISASGYYYIRNQKLVLKKVLKRLLSGI